MTELLYLSLEHMLLVLLAVAGATILGILLGILAYQIKILRTPILALVDILQTIPSLALLALLMIFFGLGNSTLIVGLVLYSLLPITRNTYTGLSMVSPSLKDAAKGMGMTRLQCIGKVELPLAFPLIFSGIKIAIVTGLSVAVIGVLIGSGGLGYPIYRGIQTRNLGKILQGAIPVVLLAFIFDYLMTKIEGRIAQRTKQQEKKK